MSNTLTVSDPIAKQHSLRLVQQLVQEIQSQGPMPFARFMQQALYAPGLGYYSAGACKLGEAGDFVTAPEISPLFSRCVARQCAQVLAEMDGGVVLELGAGTGRMALEIMRELERVNCMPAQYLILEVSADLRQRQQQLLQLELGDLFERVVWLDRLPEQINGVIVANEVMDALPINLFRWIDGVQEGMVDYKNEQFELVYQPAELALEQAVEQLGIPFENGYCSEINLIMPTWIESLSETINQGLLLLIDYGFPRHEFYHPERRQGTLMCHYQHQAHSDPLINVGLQDITAHVDFTTVAEAAVANDLMVAGFTHQAAFLLNCGLTDFVNAEQSVVDHYQVAQQIKQLTLPSEMGELFKAIALTKNFDQPLLGFQSMDQRERL